MNKYENALLQLAIHQNAFKQCNKEISKALYASYEAEQSKLQKDFYGTPKWPSDWDETWSKKNQHLARAYEMKREHLGSGMYDEYYVHHDHSPREYLSEHCMHALRAHDLIQERKDLKKNLGVAKRRVTFLANQLLKNNTQH